MMLSPHRWTVVADRPIEALYGEWRWHNGFSHRAMIGLSDANEVILMQRERDGFRELVARVATPRWKAVQNARKHMGRSAGWAA